MPDAKFTVFTPEVDETIWSVQFVSGVIIVQKMTAGQRAMLPRVRKVLTRLYGGGMGGAYYAGPSIKEYSEKLEAEDRNWDADSTAPAHNRRSDDHGPQPSTPFAPAAPSGIAKRAEATSRAVLSDVLIRALSYQLYVDRPEDDFVKGHTWPLHAVSMGGTAAMRNVVDLIEKVMAANVPGDFVETGVWKGANGILARKLLDAAGDTREVYSLDSYEWLPPPDAAHFKADQGDKHHTYAKRYAVLSADLQTVTAIHKRFGINVNHPQSRTHLVKGYFNTTAVWLSSQVRAIAILRLDGDMFQSTWEVLAALYGKVSVGGFVIVDDYGLRGAKMATDEFRECAGIQTPLVPILPNGSRYLGGRWGKVFWRKRHHPIPQNLATCQQKYSL